MIELNEQSFAELLENSAYRARFKRDLKFKASIADFPDTLWPDIEVLPIWNRAANGGMLLLQPDDELFIVPFEMSQAHYPQGSSLICNFCCTWHSGPGAGLLIYFPIDLEEGNTFGTNCCRDLKCSEHVRTKTNAAVRSRVQLPETMSEEARIRRLKKRLQQFVENAQL